MSGEMGEQTAREIVAVLLAAYPSAAIAPSTIGVYVAVIQDFTEQEARRAVNALVATNQWLPSVAELRTFVIEERLALPTPHEAWELVLNTADRHAAPKRPCITCAGTGFRLYEAGDSERTAEERLCLDCCGQGEVPDTDAAPPALPAVVRRAVDSVGGFWEIRRSENPGILRAQFLKAYAEFRSEAVRVANLESIGLTPIAARELVQLEAGDRALAS